MSDDKEIILKMNSRILVDMKRVELDRATQIRKLIFNIAQALTENSERVMQVYDGS